MACLAPLGVCTLLPWAANLARAQEAPPDAPVFTQVSQTPGDATIIRYRLEGVDVEGNSKTRKSTLVDLIDLEPGATVDVDDPRFEELRWRLLGTGWFRDVQLALKRGKKPGSVRLVVRVKERNTIVIKRVALGVSEGVKNTADVHPDLVPYLGIEALEGNFLGSGTALSLATVVSSPQQGVRLEIDQPGVLGKGTALRSFLFFNNARDFFGDDDTKVSIRCPAGTTQADCPESVLAKNAVVLYRRYGLGTEARRYFGQSFALKLGWRFEMVDVYAKPDAASEKLGTRTVPIDFSIDDGMSHVSMLNLGLSYDTRDAAVFTRRGWLVTGDADLSSIIIGSGYGFSKYQASLRKWFPLASKHVLRVGAFAGAIVGRAPFFYKFYPADLTELIPARMLGLNLDRRAPPNILGTSIGEMRQENLAARLDTEYAVALHRGEHGIYGVDAYLGAGLFSLGSMQHIRTGIPGYTGFEAIPLGLTFDIGAVIDTDIGVFRLGLSTLFGFVRW